MPGTATTLQGRLLCASGCAYAILAGETTLDPQSAAPYYAGVGFASPPVTFLSGNQDINACLVGTTADGVVVAFRGTLALDGPFTLAKVLDWVNDLNAAPRPGNGLPGQVHAGFLASLDSLWSNVRSEVKNQLSRAGAGTPLLITGHSNGGGIAPLAAMRLRTQDGLAAKVITFAAPKSGDADFANAYNAVADHTRYEIGEDIVPHLPPSATLLGMLRTVAFFNTRLSLSQFDYERVGTLLYITRSLEIVPDPENALLNERRLRIAQLLVTGHAQQIADDHRIACGYGYMTALCPSGVCPQPVPALGGGAS